MDGQTEKKKSCSRALFHPGKLQFGLIPPSGLGDSVIDA